MRDIFFQSKHESKIDNDYVICPYCEHKSQAAYEHTDEDSRVVTCDECEKRFHLRDVISVDHRTRPDCELNGATHEWDSIAGNDENYQTCGVCDKGRFLRPAPNGTGQQP